MILFTLCLTTSLSYYTYTYLIPTPLIRYLHIYGSYPIREDLFDPDLTSHAHNTKVNQDLKTPPCFFISTFSPSTYSFHTPRLVILICEIAPSSLETNIRVSSISSVVFRSVSTTWGLEIETMRKGPSMSGYVMYIT
ncbi:uncharacterized protein F4807DRAFT_433000 [Annulohypoxylon truncatum]|uniref:uncharacterized protein n=1 Tax=Annulohypoxylon truncatum TaxID=327061 RepID=UPI0020074D2C|nr:uncharacterized protein F4807DRAFT_433000 [Annulohypoxylon truncatum]KAI1208051.1 hypothetical protein F4807DRAFT_433000 [Annulohypoxylon truncatum]